MMIAIGWAVFIIGFVSGAVWAGLQIEGRRVDDITERALRDFHRRNP